MTVKKVLRASLRRSSMTAGTLAEVRKWIPGHRKEEPGSSPVESSR